MTRELERSSSRPLRRVSQSLSLSLCLSESVTVSEGRVVVDGRRWSSMVVDGRRWSSMVVDGRRWSSMVVDGRRWSSMYAIPPVGSHPSLHTAVGLQTDPCVFSRPFLVRSLFTMSSRRVSSAILQCVKRGGGWSSSLEGYALSRAGFASSANPEITVEVRVYSWCIWSS